MKIADFKGEAAFEIIGEIAGYAEAICSDTEIREKLFKAKEVVEGSENADEAVDNAGRIINYFTVAKIAFTKYAHETMGIMAVLNETSIEDLNLNPWEIIGQVAEILKESVTCLIPLFFSSVQKTAATSSGNALENMQELKS